MCSRLAAESWLPRATAVLRDCVFGGRSAKDHLHDDRQPRRPPEWREEGGHGGWLLAPERRAVFGPVRVAFAR